MNEALGSVLECGFNDLGLTRIVAYTHKDNSNSSRLLEKNNFIVDPSGKDEDNLNIVVYWRVKNTT
jgi:ribosomal-protein-alanine N-acetyltransferase